MPSDGKETFTAAMVVRGLLAEQRPTLAVGLLVGWIVGRLAVCCPVSGDVDVMVAAGRKCSLFVGL
jgi:hypothetical protein